MRFRALTLFLVFSLLAGFSSCKKTPKKIGHDLQPNNSLVTVSFSNNQDIEASTFTVPSLSTKNLNYAFTGNMQDPVFGNTNLDFYTQFRLSTSSLSWGSNAVTDSVVLCLCYNGYYGDTTDKQLTVRVFEIAESMSADTAYKSNMTLQCETEELGNITFVPRPLTPMDSTIDRGVLRIPMSNSIGDKLIVNGPYENNSDFKDSFHGLHILCDKNETPASVISFNLNHTYSYLRVYYHNDDDTLKYDFVVKSSDVRFNHYTHDYANSEIEFYQTDQQKLYVQGAAGTRVWVNFPNLQEWADSLKSNIAINDARLILSSAVDANDTLYIPPTKLVAAGAKFDADTSYVIIPDQLINAEYFGGTYNESNRSVWFRITEYIQSIIKNGEYATECNGLFIYVDQGSLMPHRWMFHSPLSDSTDKRIRLDIVYSLIND